MVVSGRRRPRLVDYTGSPARWSLHKMDSDRLAAVILNELWMDDGRAIPQDSAVELTDRLVARIVRACNAIIPKRSSRGRRTAF